MEYFSLFSCEVVYILCVRLRLLLSDSVGAGMYLEGSDPYFMISFGLSCILKTQVDHFITRISLIFPPLIFLKFLFP